MLIKKITKLTGEDGKSHQHAKSLNLVTSKLNYKRLLI